MLTASDDGTSELNNPTAWIRCSWDNEPAPRELSLPCTWRRLIGCFDQGPQGLIWLGRVVCHEQGGPVYRIPHIDVEGKRPHNNANDREYIH